MTKPHLYPAVAFVASLLGVLLLSSVPARANVLDTASVTPTCTNYEVCITGHNGNTPPLSAGFSFTITPNSGTSIGPITGTVPSSSITIGPAPDLDFNGCVTNPYPSGPLTGSLSFTISGTATLFANGVTENTVSISSTGSLTCPVPNQCPLTQGFWKNHPDAWPVSMLMLGTVTYTEAQLLTILETPPAGDASLILAHQLIAAKLNIANGSNPSPISATISDADGDIGSSTIPANVAASSALGTDMTNDANTLDSFNSSNPSSCTGPS
jgi:hypothetical protein